MGNFNFYQVENMENTTYSQSENYGIKNTLHLTSWVVISIKVVEVNNEIQHTNGQLINSTVELFPVVGLATGTILGAADVCRAGPHSTPRSTNVFLETLSEGV